MMRHMNFSPGRREKTKRDNMIIYRKDSKDAKKAGFFSGFKKE
jgi:hypothetical protein